MLFEYVEDPVVQRNFDRIAMLLEVLSRVPWYIGPGAPTASPVDPHGNPVVALGINTTGGVGSSFYVYNTVGWVAVA